MKKYLFIFPILFFLWFIWSLFVPIQYDFFRKSSGNVVYEIQPGFSSKKIISDLKEKKLIRFFFPYEWFYRWHTLKAGEYSLFFNMSPYEIFNTLSKGDVLTYDVTFPEGMNMFEMANLLNSKNLILSKNFLKWSQNPQFVENLLGEKLESLEGYLYPNTYQVTRGMKAKVLLRLMVEEFLKVYNSLPSSSLSRHQVVILASIVEKETGASSERKLISSVFHNRLKSGMRLESDPTILYGILRETGRMPRNIRKKDILKKTAYNTYRLKKFPKGPIGNPGWASLQAVIKPEKTSFYFFVSRNDGTHVFSKNFKDHIKAVNIYQKKIRKKIDQKK